MSSPQITRMFGRSCSDMRLLLVSGLGRATLSATVRWVSYVSASNLAYAHPGGSTLFEGVSFKIPPGAHVGVVGVNGVGKSTLFALITGRLPGVAGDVSTGGRVAHMPQDVG